MAARPITLLFTCEHGGHEIPPEHRGLFRGAARVLKSHRGWDPGALELAQHFSQAFDAPLFSSTTSRLLVELNRSQHHRALFSEFTRGLSVEEKQRIIDNDYRPHREAVEAHIAAQVAGKRRVLHIGVHSFTPVLNGAERTADIGLLFDPARMWESAFCRTWQAKFRQITPGWRVRRNYPYLGKADGFTTYLRSKFKDAEYAGIELEVTQRWPFGRRSEWQAAQATLVETLAAALT